MSRGVYTYLRSVNAGGGNNTAETTITTSAYVSPTSRSGVFGYYVNNSGAAGNFNLISIAGTSGWQGQAPAMTTFQGSVQLATDDSRNLKYRVSLGTINLGLSVFGFFE